MRLTCSTNWRGTSGKFTPTFRCTSNNPLARPSNAAIDILIRNGDQAMALELKYLCQRVEYDVDGKPFALKPQGAKTFGAITS